MIDPISIGAAFVAAQSVVSNIKSAMNTSKDVVSIVNDIGKFFTLESDIQKANIQLKLNLLKKSDSELQAQALQTAFMANQMIEYKKELKNLLYWSGNAEIWDNMQKEHIRLVKEKHRLEREQKEAERKRKERLAEVIFNGVIVFSIFVVLGILASVLWIIFTKNLSV